MLTEHEFDRQAAAFAGQLIDQIAENPVAIAAVIEVAAVLTAASLIDKFDGPALEQNTEVMIGEYGDNVRRLIAAATAQGSHAGH